MIHLKVQQSICIFHLCTISFLPLSTTLQFSFKKKTKQKNYFQKRKSHIPTLADMRWSSWWGKNEMLTIGPLFARDILMYSFINLFMFTLLEVISFQYQHWKTRTQNIDSVVFTEESSQSVCSHHWCLSDRPFQRGSVRTIRSISFFHSIPSEMTLCHSLQTSSAEHSERASRKDRMFSAMWSKPWAERKAEE